MIEHDVVVVGGGVAGLSAALMLARARRSVLVIDAGEPRNAPAAHLHNYLSRDGAAPGDLLAAGRAEITGYGGQIKSGMVVSAARLDSGGFAIHLADGTTVHGRRLLVATGLVDELPDVPGVAERWGRDVVHCPYCHGWEVRDQVIGVLGTGPLVVHSALMWRQLSPHVTVFTHTAPPLDDAEREQLVASGVTVVEATVAALEIHDDRLAGVRLSDGNVIECQALAVTPRYTARADVLRGLGLPLTEQRFGEHAVGTHVAGEPTGATAVPGVWVAGNVSDVMDHLSTAAAAGTRSAAAINADLVAEEAARALEAYRLATASPGRAGVTFAP